VHQSLLCERSPYFAAATKEHWKEGQEHRIPLPDDSSLAVGLYVQWIYAGKIFSRPSKEEADDKSSCDEQTLLVEAFIFGEKVQDGQFKDAIVDSILTAINDPGKDGKLWYPGGQIVDRAYEGTPEGSPLRMLMVDIYVKHGSRGLLHKISNIDFVKDLAGDLYIDRKFSPRLDTIGPKRKNCQYHHHGKERPCYNRTV
jgi:hypothetical protein